MADLDPAVARARFGAFVGRTLRAARDNGLTDRKISAISKVSTSTIHRWKNGEGASLPEIAKVRAFVAAAGASIDDAMAALGMTEDPPEPTPEQPLPRDVQIILRRLTDPATPESEREFIRASLEMLADRARTAGKAKPEAS